MASSQRGTRQAARSPIPDSPTYSSFPVPRNITTSSSRPTENMAAGLLQSIPGTPPGDPPAPPPPLPLPPIPTQAGTHPVLVRKASGGGPTAPVITGRASTIPRKASIGHHPQTTPTEAYLHAIRDKSNEQSYQCLRERPSVPLLSTDVTTISIRPRSGSTRSAPAGPCISIVTGKGRNLHHVAGAPNVPTVPTRYGRVPTPVGCLPGTGGLRIEDWAIFGGPSEERGGERPRWELPEGCLNPGPNGSYRRRKTLRDGGLLTEVRQKVKNMIKGLHVSVSISFGEKGVAEELDAPRQTRKEMTLRIKNNKVGSCIYEIIRHEDSGDEILTPIDDLKSLFPYSKQLQKRLIEWNRHYQNPPQHWVMNFIPRAYLKRGYSLGEELCEYFTQHPDGCQYRIEYEPIGHAYCHVGTIEPRARRKSRRAGDMLWEKEADHRRAFFIGRGRSA